MLFPKPTEWTDQPAFHDEPTYTFLCRSTWKACREIREILEEWFSRYPVDHQKEFLTRFQSKRNATYRAAFFELYIHQMLLTLGYDVEVHPTISVKQTKTPDFLARSESGDEMYVEATVITDIAPENVARETMMNKLYSKLDELQSSDVFVWIQIQGKAISSPPIGKIKKFLAERIEGIDIDVLRSSFATSGIDDLPHWPFVHGDLALTFIPIPKSGGGRDTSKDRLLGVWFNEPKFVDHRASIFNSIKAKATRYGELSKPYLLVVNTMGMMADEEDLTSAMFGRTMAAYHDRGSDSVVSRLPDGVWYGPHGYRNRRLSGVLALSEFGPWDIPRKTPTLLMHPSPNFPLEGRIAEFPSIILGNDAVSLLRSPGSDPLRSFGLPSDWGLQRK